MLLALVRGNARYSGSHLREMGKLVRLGGRVMASGTGAGGQEFSQARRRWFGDYEFVYQEQSALLGAGTLGRFHATGAYPVRRAGTPGARFEAVR